MQEREDLEFAINECKRLIVIPNITIFFYAPLNNADNVSMENSVYACKIDGNDRVLVMNILGRWRHLTHTLPSAFEIATELKKRLKNKSN